jgi:hypothetical protein
MAALVTTIAGAKLLIQNLTRNRHAVFKGWRLRADVEDPLLARVGRVRRSGTIRQRTSCREVLIPCSEGWISKVQYKYEMRMPGIAVSPPHLGC